LELQRADVPFVKRGGFKFIETAHVKDVLAHLRIVANPRDAVSWHRVLLLLDGCHQKQAYYFLPHHTMRPPCEAVHTQHVAYTPRSSKTSGLLRSTTHQKASSGTRSSSSGWSTVASRRT